MKCKKEKEKPLKRAECYRRVLKVLGMKPATKTPEAIAYFTTDHLRALNARLEEVEKCQSPKTR